MRGKELIDELKKQFGIKTDSELKKATGLSIPTINNWKSNPAKLTPLQIGNLIKKARRKERKDIISTIASPIVEYYEVKVSESRQGAKDEIISSVSSKGKSLKKELENSQGIYVFYNSQCKVIYLGKAKKQSLWKEMNLAFNRERDSQFVWRVQHPDVGQTFVPAFKKPRKLQKTYVFLSEIAAYFSAYVVAPDLIDNIEALMIRCFANDLTNTRMETIK